MFLLTICVCLFPEIFPFSLFFYFWNYFFNAFNAIHYLFTCLFIYIHYCFIFQTSGSKFFLYILFFFLYARSLKNVFFFFQIFLIPFFKIWYSMLSITAIDHQKVFLQLHIYFVVMFYVFNLFRELAPASRM